jgi:hypothetical protein
MTLNCINKFRIGCVRLNYSYCAFKTKSPPMSAFEGRMNNLNPKSKFRTSITLQYDKAHQLYPQKV